MEKQFDRKAAAEGLRSMARNFEAIGQRAEYLAGRIDAGAPYDEVKKLVAEFLGHMEKMYSNLPTASPLDPLIDH